ncbi:MAG: chemotaxis protein CheW [Nitrospirota bacterium]|nr:chemotaxis protein CheW [Nitrospirota bacterium]
MNNRNVEPGGFPSEIDLLMFNSTGVTMAVDTGQVDCIMNPEQAEQHGISFFTLNEILGLQKEPAPAASIVMLYKHEGKAYGLGVDRLDAIIAVSTRAIQPIPEPLSYFEGPRLFWGAVLHGNNVVLLVDLYRLKGRKSYKAAPSA